MSAAADIGVGDRVTYAGGLYEVAERHADLLTLQGVACIDVRTVRGAKLWGRSGSARARVTVLASDVRRVEAEGE